MCTFPGILTEYPWISIDSFQYENCQASKVFFISHIHTDHLRGLAESTFQKYVTNNRSIRIYCSEISRYFLSSLSAYKHLSQFYSAINVNQPYTIYNPFDKSMSVTVTCFGSAHCPGSLMLLFEGSGGTVLYTGDFRLYSHQSHRYRIVSSRKIIDTLYMDMTFFEPSIRQLPTREHACQELIHFIEQNDSKTIYLKASARVGYEYIYMSLYQYFGSLIHVHTEQYNLYNCLPQVQQALTTNAQETKIHACWPKCPYTKSSITIVLSVLWFTLQKQQQFKSPLIQIATNHYRLCYSLHSSYNELCTFIRQMNPGRIHPIALTSQITQERFNELLQQFHLDQKGQEKSPESSQSQQQIKRRYSMIDGTPVKDNDSDNELDFDCIDKEKNNEQQLYKRIVDLQQSSNKNLKKR